MKKFLLVLSLLGLVSTHSALADSTLGNAGSNASKASEHSLAASGHTAVSVGQVAVAVVELPLVAVDLAGDSLQDVGNAMVKATHRQLAQPLEITEITITVDPSPKAAMNTPQQQD